MLTFSFLKIPANELEKYLSSHVTTPMDAILYEIEGDDDHFHVAYYKDFCGVMTTKRSMICTFKIKKSDVNERNMSLEDLAKYISKGLKVAVGWGYQEKVEGMELTQDNMYYTEQTHIVLRRIAQSDKFIQFITSNSPISEVQKNIFRLFPFERPFYDVFGSTQEASVSWRTSQDKIKHDANAQLAHFNHIWFRLNQEQTLDADQCLLLDREDPFIDMVSSYIVEHDIAKKNNFDEKGIKFIAMTADGSHLTQINEQLRLHLDIQAAPQLVIDGFPQPRTSTSTLGIASVSDNEENEELQALDEDSEVSQDESEAKHLITLSVLPSIRKNLDDYPSYINDKINELQRALLEEERELKTREKTASDLQLKQIQLRRFEIKKLIDETNAITQQLIDYYTVGAANIIPEPKPESIPSINIEAYLEITKRKRLLKIQQDAEKFQTNLMSLTKNQRYTAIAYGFVCAVIGFIAGAMVGFMVGAVIGNVVGATAGAFIGGSIGMVALGTVTGTLTGALSGKGLYGRFFADNQKDSIKKKAAEYNAVVQHLVHEEMTGFANKRR